jgi:hypothetical protein
MDLGEKLPILFPVPKAGEGDPESGAFQSYAAALYAWNAEQSRHGTVSVTSQAPEFAADAFIAGMQLMAIRLEKAKRAERASANPPQAS